MFSIWILLTEVEGEKYSEEPNWRTRFCPETNVLIAESERQSKWIVDQVLPCTSRTEAVLMAGDWTLKQEEVVKFRKRIAERATEIDASF